MRIQELSLKDALLIFPQIYFDERGFFLEHYHKPLYQKNGLPDFIQDNHSCSKKGTMRGMHFQRSPGQAKLISVLFGEIFDVIVDIRPDSKTFGKWESVILNDELNNQLFIPVGFAHGFYVLSPKAHVLYKVSSVYNPKEEKCFRYDDQELKISWPAPPSFISSKDREALSFNEVVTLS